jgi:hypothetical protein
MLQCQLVGDAARSHIQAETVFRPSVKPRASFAILIRAERKATLFQSPASYAVWSPAKLSDKAFPGSVATVPAARELRGHRV